MSSIDDIRRFRIEKLEALRERGIDPYPIESKRDATIQDVLSSWAKFSRKKGVTTLAGRVLAIRGQGGIIFFDIFDGTGKIQILLKKGEVEEEALSLFEEGVDIGDFVEASGTFFTTKREEKTLQTASWGMLTKSLRPLPEKWHGLQDVEEKMRKRYLDLLSSQEVRERFYIRSKIISELRRLLDEEDFLEVETPILQPLAGGASAKPFKTHHHTLDTDLYLRIAPELYLKQLLIGGFPKVYEIGRSFRNEGIDVTHNPEFTMVEWYESFSDAKKQRVFVEKVLKAVVKKVIGKSSVSFGEETIDFSKPFTVVSYAEVLKHHALIADISSLSREEAKLTAERFGLKVEAGDSTEKILDSIYKKSCRPKLIQPTFIIDYPTEYLPLAKKHPGKKNLVDAFQVVIGGIEFVKAFSELNDPIDQEERFLAQEKNKKAGDDEAQPNDREFVEALEYGMPPSAGLGLGIDRLAMLLTDSRNIRDVIFFPTLKPKKD